VVQPSDVSMPLSYKEIITYFIELYVFRRLACVAAFYPY
jgi:hypothetical protein